MMRAVQGTPNDAAQKGLKPALVKQNYFLSCSCVTEQDLEVALPDAASFRYKTRLLSKDKLTGDITRLRLECPSSYEYFAGQYLTVYSPSGVARNYSIASVPEVDSFLELHVRLVPDGQVSGWIFEELREGDEIVIGQPIGNCVYTDECPEQPLLLIGTGSGLAPLYGILRDALHQGHRGEIKLYHGSSTLDGVYLVDELRELAEQHGNFSYFPCVSRDSENGFLHGRASDLALQDNPKLSGWRAYICGNPDMVKVASRNVFLAGVSLQEVYTDAFLLSKP
jgi:NAD(P)H-flavin reductase